MAAIYLKPLDDGMARAGIALVRYMDDWVIMTTRRHHFRKRDWPDQADLASAKTQNPSRQNLNGQDRPGLHVSNVGGL